ncbi:TonB-dependent hemoglobin/transferrin/lactoferrin family receptor [Pararhodobacter oceanensis]|uniref:TonB-dependent hemoglobin/transferrin/lactoferrin family receptor n=1 Tax=Pararhodobacter oceanensis TaxID=2172121 RepID=UPI003A8E4E8C
MRHSFSMRARLLASAGGIALLSLAQPASAQAVDDADEQLLLTEDTTETAGLLHRMLGRITFFAGRLPRPVLDVPATVTVIDGEDLQEQGVTDMQQMARYVPGLTVNRQINAAQPFNDFGGFSMRGVGGNRVLTLVDGSRVAEAIIDGTRDYLDFSFVRQAEVVRGPASVTWGADALGGVVALQTIAPEDLLEGGERGGEMRTSYDSFTNTRTGTVSFAQRLSDQLSVLVGYSHIEANEPELSNAAANGGLYSDIHGGCPRDLAAGATPCNAFDPTDIETDHALFRAEFRPTTEHRFSFTADLMRRVTDVAFNQNLGDPTASGTYVTSDDRRQILRRNRFALEHEWTPESGIVDALTTSFAYVPHSYLRTGERRYNNASGETEVSWDSLAYDEDFFELDIQAHRQFSLGATDHELVFGFDGDLTYTDYERMTRVQNMVTGSDVTTLAGGFNFANATTRRSDIYVQDRIEFGGGRFELTPGLRYATYAIDPRPNADYSVVPGSEPQRRDDSALLAALGARAHLNDNWTLWANASQGFKMPTAQQLYTSLPGAWFNLIPAPDLRPEYVNNFEIGARGEFDRGFVSASLFRADYSDFIQSFYNPPGTSDYTYRNISEREVWGFELAGEMQINDALTFTTSLNYQEGVQRATPTSSETPVNLRPLSGVIGLNWESQSRPLAVDLYSRFAGGVSETSSATGFRPGGYALLDLFVRYDLTDTAMLSFGVTNLLDTAYYQDSAIGVTTTPSEAVARQNPLDLHMGPGRVFTLQLASRF